MLYGLFELGFVVVIVAFLTAPLWGNRPIGWMTRPFGANGEDEPETPSNADEATIELHDHLRD